MKPKQILAILLAAFLLLAALAGCSAEAPSYAPGEGGNFVSGDKNNADSDSLNGSSGIGSVGVQNQKLIRTIRLSAETEDLSALLARVEDKLALLGGYVENKEVRNGSTNSSYRSATLTVRIPAERLDEFVDQVSDASNITYSSETTEDVTLSYVATQSRITALETEEARLLELLAKAETMDDLLLIESKLTDIRTELEQVTSQLRLYDNLVDYGTVRLELTQVQTFTVVEEQTVWQRISTGFSESMANLGSGLTELIVFFLTRLPYLIPLGVAAVVVLLIVKLTNRKPKKPSPPENKENS